MRIPVVKAQEQLMSARDERVALMNEVGAYPERPTEPPPLYNGAECLVAGTWRYPNAQGESFKPQRSSTSVDSEHSLWPGKECSKGGF